MIFINAPGVNPNKYIREIKPEGTDLDVQAMGEDMEIKAMNKIEEGKINGSWVMLENIHLMEEWLKELNKTIDDIASGGS
jgi:dynein heavy chain